MGNDRCGICGLAATHWPVGEEYEAYCCHCAACDSDDHINDGEGE